MSETPPPVDPQAHREVWNLLPWIVNGTAGDEDRRRAERHLEGCADCREEFAFQRLVQRGIAADDTAPSDPAPGWERLRTRLDAAEMDATDATRRSSPREMRWVPALMAAVVVQALGLGALGALVWSERSAAPEAAYRTLSDAPARRGAVWRLVPAPTLPLAELRSLLQSHGLDIVDSSADGSILGVAPTAGASPRDATLQALRADRRVLLAEPISGGLPR